MQTSLAPEFQSTQHGQMAERILRSCVHCGFCTATCPTYQLLGDELDGPRGRIYLIKQVMEGATPTRKTQTHLDRCLSCRNYESTCPSGVEYGKLLDIGRAVVEDKVRRPWGEKMVRTGLRRFLKSPRLFALAMRLGTLFRPLLPKVLADKIPQVAGSAPALLELAPQSTYAKKVLLLSGCVQDNMAADINPATVRLLNAINIGVLRSTAAQCCGSLDHHLNAHDAAVAQVQSNIDAWWPLVENGLSAIIGNASACALMLKDYGVFMAHVPLYAEKAKRISALSQDISQVIGEHWAVLKPQLQSTTATLAYHPPCTLQHGMKLKGGVETMLIDMGYQLQSVRDSHLCCGSAGTYSVLQPMLSSQLKSQKLNNLLAHKPSVIASSNIGCLSHLQSGTDTRVAHWVTLMAEHLKNTP
jgi:glycolate oxidase iron-sulfur subunit